MRLALDSDPRLNLIRSYASGVITIGEQQLSAPFIVSPTRLVVDWAVTGFEELTERSLEPLLSFGAGIVLIGAGDQPPPPSSALRAQFRARGIGLECMNLGAACRTYNVLASEGRDVVAGLFPGYQS